MPIDADRRCPGAVPSRPLSTRAEAGTPVAGRADRAAATPLRETGTPAGAWFHRGPLDRDAIDILRIDDDDVLLSHRDRALGTTREHALPNDQDLHLAGLGGALLDGALLDGTLLGRAQAYSEGPCQEGDYDHAQHPWRHAIHDVAPFDAFAGRYSDRAGRFTLSSGHHSYDPARSMASLTFVRSRCRSYHT
jgi:hypothetical protein